MKFSCLYHFFSLFYVMSMMMHAHNIILLMKAEKKEWKKKKGRRTSRKLKCWNQKHWYRYKLFHFTLVEISNDKLLGKKKEKSKKKNNMYKNERKARFHRSHVNNWIGKVCSFLFFTYWLRNVMELWRS